MKYVVAREDTSNVSHLSFETKQDSDNAPKFSFAFKIFINGKFKRVKSYVTTDYADTFSIVPLISTIENCRYSKIERCRLFWDF